MSDRAEKVYKETVKLQVVIPTKWAIEIDKLRKFQSRSSYIKTIVYEYLLKIGRVEQEY